MSYLAPADVRPTTSVMDGRRKAFRPGQCCLKRKWSCERVVWNILTTVAARTVLRSSDSCSGWMRTGRTAMRTIPIAGARPMSMPASIGRSRTCRGKKCVRIVADSITRKFMRVLPCSVSAPCAMHGRYCRDKRDRVSGADGQDHRPKHLALP